MAIASRWLWKQRLTKASPHVRGRVLDVGAGNCAAREHTVGQYIGLERDRDFLPTDPGIIRTQGSADHLPFRDGAFDTVLAMAVMEHVDDPVTCMREAARVLAPGGRLVITTPTPIGDRIHHFLAIFNITSKHAAEEHQSVMDRAQLHDALRRAGMRVVHFRVFLLGGNQVLVAVPVSDDQPKAGATADPMAA
jgi:ubiquinone/menaquinone biosynthesis C-methylase UbiE